VNDEVSILFIAPICTVEIDGNVIVPLVLYVYDDGDDTYVILLPIVLIELKSIVSKLVMVIVSSDVVE
jgi:hypothetical protein